MPSEEHSTTIHTQLSRDMGLFSVTMIGVGAMIGAGIFVLTGIAAGTAGPGLLLAFVFNGVISLITAMAYAELGASFPEAGGGYLWVKESLPNPIGFISGWISWFAHSVACSLYALGFSVYFTMFLKTLGIEVTFVNEGDFYKALAVIVCILLGYINYRGAKETGRAGAIITIAKIVILGIFVGAGLYRINSIDNWEANFKPFLPNGYSGLFMAMGLTFIAFEGYEIIAQSGEEVKNPHKNIPRAIFLSLLIVVPIYLLVGFSAIGSVQVEGISSWEYLGKMKELAILEAARKLFPGGALIILFGGLLSTLSALNATIYSSSRVAFAMGRDANLPGIFNRVSSKTHTPVFAILITIIVVSGMAVMLPIEDVASAANIMFLFLFIFVNMALVNLRRLKPELTRYFRVPFVPVLPFIGIASLLLITLCLSIFSPLAWLTVSGWIFSGILIYYFYSSRLEKEVKGSKVLFTKLDREKKEYSILMPVISEDGVDSLSMVASLLCRTKAGEIIGMSIVEVPEQLPLKEGFRFSKIKEDTLEKLKNSLSKTDVPFHLMVRVAHRIDEAILDAIEEYEIKFLLLGWDGRTSRIRTFGKNIDPLIRMAPCDVGILSYKALLDKGRKKKWLNDIIKIFRRRRFGTEKGFETDIKRILIPTAGGPNARFAVELSVELARSNDITVTVVAFATGNGSPVAEKFIEDTLKDIDLNSVKLEKKILRDGTLLEALLNEAKQNNLVIIGASRRSLYYQMRKGSLPVELAIFSDVPVLIVKKFEGAVRSWLKRFLGI